MFEAKDSGFVLDRSAPVATTSRRRWVIVATLFLFMAINFADKAVLGLVALPLMHDMQLTHAQFGIVGSAFFLLFALSGISVGLVADRLNVKWLLAGLALVWAVAQLPLAWPTSFAVLLACRILLGAGEGPASPLALHVVYTWFEDHERSLPTTIVQQGATTGIILAGPVLTFIAQRWYWHAAFLSLGVVGVMWTLLWLSVGKSGDAHRRQPLDECAARWLGAGPLECELSAPPHRPDRDRRDAAGACRLFGDSDRGNLGTQLFPGGARVQRYGGRLAFRAASGGADSHRARAGHVVPSDARTRGIVAAGAWRTGQQRVHREWNSLLHALFRCAAVRESGGDGTGERAGAPGVHVRPAAGGRSHAGLTARRNAGDHEFNCNVGGFDCPCGHGQAARRGGE